MLGLFDADLADPARFRCNKRPKAELMEHYGDKAHDAVTGKAQNDRGIEDVAIVIINLEGEEERKENKGCRAAMLKI